MRKSFQIWIALILHCNQLCCGTQEDIRTIGSSYSGDDKWLSGVVARTGVIYGIPCSATHVLRIDPASDNVTTIGSLHSGSCDKWTPPWQSGVVASTGVIYGIPCSATHVLRIDPASDNVTTIGSSYSGSSKWCSGVVASTGVIYGIPHSATNILRINPASDSVTTIGSLASGNGKWLHAVVANTGVIYGIPFHATHVLRIDPASDNVTTIGPSYSGYATPKWLSGVVARTGVIYGIPFWATHVLRIDPASDNVTTIGSLHKWSSSHHLHYPWSSGVVASTGVIYGIRSSAKNVLRIDPASDSVTMIGNPQSGHAGWGSGVVANTGVIYGIPYSAPYILRIDPASDSVTAIESSYTVLGYAKWWHAVVANTGVIYGIPSHATHVLRIDPGSIATTTTASTSPATYVVGNWSLCSVSCGIGQRKRPVLCLKDGESYSMDQCLGLQPAKEEECVEPECPPPVTTSLALCTTADAPDSGTTKTHEPHCECPRTLPPEPVERDDSSMRPAKYATGEWGPCSVSCGDGQRKRPVWCKKDGQRYALDQCPGLRPAEKETCIQPECPLLTSTLPPPCTTTDKFQGGTTFVPSEPYFECNCSGQVPKPESPRAKGAQAPNATQGASGTQRNSGAIEPGQSSFSTSAPTTEPHSTTKGILNISECPNNVTVKKCWLDDISIHSGPTTGMTKVALRFRDTGGMIPHQCDFGGGWMPEVTKDIRTGQYFCLSPAWKMPGSSNFQVALSTGERCYQERSISFEWYENPKIKSANPGWCWAGPQFAGATKIHIQLDKPSPQLKQESLLKFGDSTVAASFVNKAHDSLETVCPEHPEKGKVPLRFCLNGDCEHEDVGTYDFHYRSREEARDWAEWLFSQLWGIIVTGFCIINWYIERKRWQLFQDRAELRYLEEELPPLPLPSYWETLTACCNHLPQIGANGIVYGQRPRAEKWMVRKHKDMEKLPEQLTKAIVQNKIAFLWFSCFECGTRSLHSIFGESACTYLSKKYGIFLHERTETVKMDVLAVCDVRQFQQFLSELGQRCQKSYGGEPFKLCFYMASREAFNNWIPALQNWAVEDQAKEWATHRLRRAEEEPCPEQDPSEHDPSARSSSCPPPGAEEGYSQV